MQKVRQLCSCRKMHIDLSEKQCNCLQYFICIKLPHLFCTSSCDVLIVVIKGLHVLVLDLLLESNESFSFLGQNKLL